MQDIKKVTNKRLAYKLGLQEGEKYARLIFEEQGEEGLKSSLAVNSLLPDEDYINTGEIPSYPPAREVFCKALNKAYKETAEGLLTK
jgi:hypothetical protein